MDYLNSLLFISIIAPVAMMIVVCKDRARLPLVFISFGMIVALACGELNTIVFNLTDFSSKYFTSNVSPIFEEVFKAFPILMYAFVIKPSRQQLLEVSLAVGVGFAIMENACVFAASAGAISIWIALLRGFGAGMMHGLCTMAVGFGMSFVHSHRTVFVAGTLALLSIASIYHGTYNILVQSGFQVVAFLLPMATFVPLVIGLKKKKIL